MPNAISPRVDIRFLSSFAKLACCGGCTRAFMPSTWAGWWKAGGDWEDHEYSRVFITYSGLDEAEAELKEAGYVEPHPVVEDFDIGVERGVQFGF